MAKEKRCYELWVRQLYKPFVKSGFMSAFIRPGDRRGPNLKGTQEGAEVTVRILKKAGSPENEPVFDSFEKLGVVEKIVVKKMKDLTKKDLVGSSPDCLAPEAVPIHLGWHYGVKFKPSDIVSIVRVKYRKRGDL
ncbi:MAG: hypothetical protein Q8Q97_00465 [bacterium]|nr:hypothetical protein [bacterium]